MPKLTSDEMLSCSQLPSLFGVSPYSKPNDTLMFCAKSILGEDARTPAGEAADWGNLLEPAIIAEIAKRLGIDRYEMPDKAFKHPDLALGASADAIAFVDKEIVIQHDPSNGIYVVDGDSITLKGNGVLESKLTRSHQEESLPLYRGPIQVQGVMMCTGLEWAAIGCLYSGIELRIFLFKPHQATQEHIANLAYDFELRLEKFRQTGELDYYPPEDNKDANRVWANANDQDIDLGDENEGIASAIIGLKAQIKEMEDQVAEKELRLKKMMQEFGSAKCGKWSIRWPMRHYKETQEKITPAKPAYSVRQSTLSIKETK